VKSETGRTGATGGLAPYEKGVGGGGAIVPSGQERFNSSGGPLHKEWERRLKRRGEPRDVRVAASTHIEVASESGIKTLEDYFIASAKRKKMGKSSGR